LIFKRPVYQCRGALFRQEATLRGIHDGRRPYLYGAVTGQAQIMVHNHEGRKESSKALANHYRRRYFDNVGFKGILTI